MTEKDHEEFIQKLNEEVELFEENRVLRGYNISVLDNWGTKVKKHSITEDEKEAYIKDFGYKMITDDEFYEWWMHIHHLKTSPLYKIQN